MPILQRYNVMLDSAALDRLRHKVGNRNVSRALRRAIRLMIDGPIWGYESVLRAVDSAKYLYPTGSPEHAIVLRAISALERELSIDAGMSTGAGGGDDHMA